MNNLTTEELVKKALAPPTSGIPSSNKRTQPQKSKSVAKKTPSKRDRSSKSKTKLKKKLVFDF